MVTPAAAPAKPESAKAPKPAPTEAPAAPARTPKAPKKLSEVAGRTAAAEAPSAPPAPTAAAPADATAATEWTGVGLAEMKSMWPAVLDALKSYSRVAWIALSVSAPLSLENGVLAVAVDAPGKVTALKSSGHDERLRQAILDVLRTDVRIDIVLAPDQAKTPSLADGDFDDDDVPSADDEDVTDATGVDLIMRELGATQIEEIEH